MYLFVSSQGPRFQPQSCNVIFFCFLLHSFILKGEPYLVLYALVQSMSTIKLNSTCDQYHTLCRKNYAPAKRAGQWEMSGVTCRGKPHGSYCAWLEKALVSCRGRPFLSCFVKTLSRLTVTADLLWKPCNVTYYRKKLYHSDREHGTHGVLVPGSYSKELAQVIKELNCR